MYRYFGSSFEKFSRISEQTPRFVKAGCALSIEVIVPREPKDPSLCSIAAEVFAAFLASKNSELCKEAADHMVAQSEVYIKAAGLTASRSKARNIFRDWSNLMLRALEDSKPSKSNIPIDPIEARIYRKKMEKASRSLTPNKAFELEPEVVAAILNDETEKKAIERRENGKLFLSHICDLATQLSEKMMIDGKTLGVTALQQPPIIIHKYGFKGVLVQSFTVERNGDRFKCDFKANQRAVNIGHPDIIQTQDNNRLIRSNTGRKGYIKGAHEFYVKGLRYEEGMVFMRYLCANGEDQSDLATYYQIDNGEVVETTVARWKEVENLLAAGRDPAESLQPKSTPPKS